MQFLLLNYQPYILAVDTRSTYRETLTARSKVVARKPTTAYTLGLIYFHDCLNTVIVLSHI